MCLFAYAILLIQCGYSVPMNSQVHEYSPTSNGRNSLNTCRIGLIFGSLERGKKGERPQKLDFQGYVLARSVMAL